MRHLPRRKRYFLFFPTVTLVGEAACTPEGRAFPEVPEKEDTAGDVRLCDG